MNLAGYVARNALRRRKRALLTMGSIAVSQFLLVVLFAVLGILFNPVTAPTSDLRLIAQPTTSFIDRLPLAHGRRIAELPGVRKVVPVKMYGGVYRDPKNFFPSAGVGEGFLDLFPELEISPGGREAFAAALDSCVVHVKLMERFGWRMGDTITLTGSLQPADMTMRIAATYDGPPAYAPSIYLHLKSLNEALEDTGTSGIFWVLAEDAEAVPRLMEQIDAMFRNSPAETRSEAEKNFVLGFLSMIGNVQAIVGGIAIVIAATMTLVTASTMAMSIRERRREIAVLKAVGFTSRRILALILSESALIGFTGAALAGVMALGLGRLDVASATNNFIARLTAGPGLHAANLLAGTAIGLFAALWPAWSAARTSVVEGLRRTD